MTGTGTQADPYVVSTWEDFVTAIGTSSAYVEFVEDTVINMDDDYSMGIASTINISCAQIDGKGTIIKNLYFNENGYFNFGNSDGIVMKNISFLNMRRDGASWYTFSFRGGTVENCVISGSFGGVGLFDTYGTLYINNSSIVAQLQNCYFSDNYYSDSRCPNIKSSEVVILGVPKLTSASDNLQVSLNNSILKGKLPTKAYYRITASIIDCDVPDNIAITNDNGSGYINSDKFGTGVTTTGLTELTDIQIHDADYLFSIGFPIGVD